MRLPCSGKARAHPVPFSEYNPGMTLDPPAPGARLAPAIARERREAAARRRQRETEAALQTRTDELAAMTEQLWQAAKLATLGELAASLAHELNNPLFNVLLHLQVLRAELPPDD